MDFKHFLMSRKGHWIPLLLVLLATASLVNAQRSDEQKKFGSPWTTGIIEFDPEFAASVNLDQCRNGTLAAPAICAGSAWVNGNLGSSNSHYMEGGSAPYRVTISGLTPGSTGNTVTLNYDTTKGGKHALDYLTNFNRTETTADPCTGTTVGCGAFSDFPIPNDPNVTGAGVTPPAGGFFRIYGGTITGVSAYTLVGTYAGDSDTSITLTFSATGTEVVIAWAGHISDRADWGLNNSAIDIAGSPYHMRIAGSGQDRSLSADAVTFPATVTIIKTVQALGGGTASTTSFPFTATGLTMTSFSLVDNNSQPADRYVDASITSFGATNTITVTESLVAGWTLANLACVETSGGAPNILNSTVNLATRTATIIAERGEQITCTFDNQQLSPTAAFATIAGRVVNDSGQGISRTMIRVFNASSGETRTTLTNPFGYFRLEGFPVGEFYVISATDKEYFFAQNDIAFNLIDDANVEFIGQARSDPAADPDSSERYARPWLIVGADGGETTP